MNKKILSAAVAMLLLSLPLISVGQVSAGDRESVIREVERREREAVLQGDTKRLEELWSPTMIVNNPQSTISPSREAVLDLVRKGAIKYASFERTIEAIRFNGDLAIVMGSEVVEPVTPNPKAGQRVKRRFTNIWQLHDEQWRVIARHANVIPE